MHIDYNEVMQNMTRVRNSSVNEFINSSTQPCRLKGRAPEDLKSFLDGYEDADTLIDLLSHGQQSIMKLSFKANGGVKIKQSSSYEKAKSLCHHAIAKLYKKGRVALLPWESLSEEEKTSFHINPLVWAPKADSWEGRVCLNLSYGKTRSVNEGTDTGLSDTIYKPLKLPDVHSLCEMIELIRQAKPNADVKFIEVR
jgi:hypothetical protein